jgi:hypothetical protein
MFVGSSGWRICFLPPASSAKEAAGLSRHNENGGMKPRPLQVHGGIRQPLQ